MGCSRQDCRELESQHHTSAIYRPISGTLHASLGQQDQRESLGLHAAIKKPILIQAFEVMPSMAYTLLHERLPWPHLAGSKGSSVRGVPSREPGR